MCIFLRYVNERVYNVGTAPTPKSVGPSPQPPEITLMRVGSR